MDVDGDEVGTVNTGFSANNTQDELTIYVRESKGSEVNVDAVFMGGVDTTAGLKTDMTGQLSLGEEEVLDLVIRIDVNTDEQTLIMFVRELSGGSTNLNLTVDASAADTHGFKTDMQARLDVGDSHAGSVFWGVDVDTDANELNVYFRYLCLCVLVNIRYVCLCVCMYVC